MRCISVSKFRLSNGARCARASFCKVDHILSLPHLDHVEALERAQYVFQLEGSDVADLFQGRSEPTLPASRMTSIARAGQTSSSHDSHLAQIRERLFRELFLALRNHAGEGDEKPPVSFTLACRECQNAQIAIFLGVDFFAKISNGWCPSSSYSVRT